MTGPRRWATTIAVLLAVAALAGCGGRSANESPVEGVPTMTLSIAGPADALTFSWKPVVGAVAYEVVVLDQAGNAAWSWTGTTTTVEPPDYAPIPDQGSATVAAFNAKHE